MTDHCTVDLADTKQTIDGFGVNINPDGHWKHGKLAFVVDQLIDDLGCHIFRFDPYGLANWHDPDGSIGPKSLSPDHLSEVYRGPAFRDAWGMARHLSKRGVEIIMNVSGIVPPWMCGDDGVTLTDYDGYAELMLSLARWAREEEGIEFKWFGAFNETDCGPPEGPFVGPVAAADALERIAERFDAAGYGDIGQVAVDQAWYDLEYLKVLVDRPALEQPIDVVGMHCYSDLDLDGARALLAERGLDWRYWLTEYGELDQSGEIEWEAALISTRRLLRGLNDGVQAGIVWDAYDNWHKHDDSWTIWGLLRTAFRDQYTPKKRYYAAKQLYRYVRPGATRVRVDGGEDLRLTGFVGPDGGLTVVGVNETDVERQLRLEVAGAASGGPGDLRLILSTERLKCEETAAIAAGGPLEVTVPGSSVFTITGAG